MSFGMYVLIAGILFVVLWAIWERRNAGHVLPPTKPESPRIKELRARLDRNAKVTWSLKNIEDNPQGYETWKAQYLKDREEFELLLLKMRAEELGLTPEQLREQEQEAAEAGRKRRQADARLLAAEAAKMGMTVEDYKEMQRNRAYDYNDYD